MTNLEQARRGAGSGSLIAGRYRLRSRLGGSSLSSPWLAKDQLLDRDVVLKPAVSIPGLPPQMIAAARQRALRDGSAAARLSHASIVTLYDVALDRDEPWMVMEHIPSIGLTQALELSTRLTSLMVAQLGAQLADALATAHRAGLLHRDVHPGNVLITNGRQPGRVKLAGFGLAHPADAGFGHLNVIGTPGYLAPEVARGEDASPASDVFSLGATLYATLEGCSPFGPDNDPVGQLNHAVSGTIRPPRRDGAAAAVVRRMLDPDAAHRPTMSEARDALAQIAAGDDNNTRFVLTAPLQVAPGEIPPWQRRSLSSPAAGSSSSVVAARRAPQSAPLWSGSTGSPIGEPRFKPRPFIPEPEIVEYQEYDENELADLMSTRKLSLIVALMLLSLGFGASVIVGIIVSQI
ncbi:serine/threonine-protein kinase [Lolliginicoccus suaedae]|uniref:serine/threonine-protein kinase n=1 Tax=Lolliginicoccus suaedae TaxID=2605429 RepID=UPI0016598606|nr:serine/threonine-protein kinase [Lolliginicoccus suaedae]